MQNPALDPNFKRFDIPVKMGLLAAVIKIVLATIQYQFLVDSWLGMMGVMVLSVAVSIFCMWLAGTQQRKAMGGVINIKFAFQAIFVVILIFVVLSNLYDIIYIKYINPDVITEIKESTLSFSERVLKADDAKLDEIAAQFDDENKQKLSVNQVVLGILQSVILYSIPGIIIAMAIKKDKTVPTVNEG
jgi:hypothetical protein